MNDLDNMYKNLPQFTRNYSIQNHYIIFGIYFNLSTLSQTEFSLIDFLP